VKLLAFMLYHCLTELRIASLFSVSAELRKVRSLWL
jgi:hypothetical protein